VQVHKVVLVYVLEPLLAGFLGMFFFRESLNLIKGVGAAFILIAIVAPILQRRLGFSRTNI